MVSPTARWGNWRAAPGLTAAGHASIERALTVIGDRITEFGTGPDRFGLVHADLRLANLMVDPSGITVIDFDDCGWSWHLTDLGAVVSWIEDTPEAEEIVTEAIRASTTAPAAKPAKASAKQEAPKAVEPADDLGLDDVTASAKQEAPPEPEVVETPVADADLAAELGL